MSGRKHPAVPRAGAGHLETWLQSWQLHLRVNAEQKTIRLYVDALTFFGSWLIAERKTAQWDDVRKKQLDLWFGWLRADGTPCPHLVGAGTPAAGCGGYSKSYVNQVGRAMQQFFAWFAGEEDLPNPMLGYRIPSAPKAGEQVVPVIEHDMMAVIISDAERGRDYRSRRDAALLRVFASSGCRIGEITGLRLGDVDLVKRQMMVTGKARKERWVKINDKCALAVDRYLRMRARRPGVSMDAEAPLWLGHRRGVPMTESGLQQAMTDRAARLGIRIHPHMWRHSFVHHWLDNGGNEGDLVELMGWESSQMLRVYGRSARSARARRNYDKVDVMGGI